MSETLSQNLAILKNTESGEEILFFLSHATIKNNHPFSMPDSFNALKNQLLECKAQQVSPRLKKALAKAHQGRIRYRALSVWLQLDGCPGCPIRDRSDEELVAVEVLAATSKINPVKMLTTSIMPEKRDQENRECFNLLRVLCPREYEKRQKEQMLKDLFPNLK